MSDVPSIIEQAFPWKAGFFHFGLAKREDVTYFNCCLLPREDDWLITRRAQWVMQHKMGLNSLMAFKLAGKIPQVGYRIQMTGGQNEHFEDPRCVMHKGNLWISACNFLVFAHPRATSRWTGAHQILSRVSTDWKTSERFDPVYGRNGPSIQSNTGEIHEKNWLWFSHDDALHLIYSAVPHEVVRWSEDIKAGQVWKTEPVHMPWSMGEIRGGTTPVRIGKEYWTFFHSSITCAPGAGYKRQYHMGAYAFEAHPPFRITKITPRPLLTGSPNDHWLPGKPACIFPCGAVMRDGKWLIVGGSNDLDCFWAEIPHEGILERCVSTLEPPQPKTRLTKAVELLTSAV